MENETVTAVLHNPVTPESYLAVGDLVPWKGQYREIWQITTDSGIQLSSGEWVCRTDLQKAGMFVPVASAEPVHLPFDAAPADIAARWKAAGDLLPFLQQEIRELGETNAAWMIRAKQAESLLREIRTHFHTVLSDAAEDQQQGDSIDWQSEPMRSAKRFVLMIDEILGEAKP